MTLDRRTVNLQIQGGVNERVDPRVAVSPIVIKNGRYTKTGTISKRIGTQCIAPYDTRYNAGVAPTTTPPAPQLLTLRDDELLRIGSGELDSVTLATAGASADHIFRGNVPECVLRKTGRIGGTWNNGDSAVVTATGGPLANRSLIVDAYTVYSTASGTKTIYVDISDALTGVVLLAQDQIDSGTTIGPSVKVGVSYGFAFVIYVTGTNVKFRYYDLSTYPAASSITTMSSCVSATGIFDATATTGSTASEWRVYAIAAANGGADYKVMYRDSGGTNTSSSVTLNSVKSVAIRADYLDTYYYAMVADQNAGNLVIYGRRFTPGGATAAAAAFTSKTYAAVPTKVQTAIGRLSDSLHVFAWSEDASKTAWFDKRNNSDAAQFGGTWRKIGYGAAGATHSPVVLATQPFTYGTKMYVGLMTCQLSAASPTVNLGTHWVVDIYAEDNNAYVDTGRWVASALPQQCARSDQFSTVPKAFSLGMGFAFNAFVVDAQQTVTTASVSNSIIRLQADFGWVPPSTTMANSLACLPGGVPTQYDGAFPVEAGFIQSPVVTAVSTSATGSALELVSTYSYCAIFSQYDKAGNVHRSPVSNVITVTFTGSNDTNVLTVSSLHATNRKLLVGLTNPTPVFVELYRTLANGSTFQLQGKYAAAVNAADISITDTTPDATLRTQPFLYTTGGILESEAPPSAGHTFRALDRIWLVDTDDGSVWFSDTVAQGEAPRFNAALTIPPPKDGRYIAGCQLDNNVVLFTRDAIDMTFGDGPDSTGVGSFGQRYRLASDVGCNEARSVSGATPYGVFFQSRYGLTLLDRSQGVHRVGVAVEDSSGATQSTAYSIVAAVNTPDRSEVWFPVDVTGVQRAVVYDVLESADPQSTETDATRPVWYVDEYTDPVGGTPKIVSGCYWSGKRTWINSAGRVYQDLSTTYLDTATGYTSAWVTLTVQTSHWNSQGLGSWMSVFGAGVLLEYLTDHRVTVSVYQDWATSSPQTGAWTTAEIATAKSGAREQLLIGLTTQKSQAVSVAITDRSPDTGTLGTGQGFRISGITLEVGPRDGMVRLPAAARK